MINKYQPHVIVLPEDDANRQIGNGFLQVPSLQPRRIQILPEAGGWTAIRDSFVREHNKAMAGYPQRRMILLVDFDLHSPPKFRVNGSNSNAAEFARAFACAEW